MALRQNIIYIYFKGKHQVTSKSQYQYNRKQYLYFADLNLPQVFEVHFSNRDKGESKTQIGNDKLVEIPDEYFWSGALQIYAWIYLHSGADDSETIYEIRIPLTKRAKPTDEEPLPVQQSAIDKAIAELNNAVNITTENVNKTESDKIIVANIKDEVVDLKEDIDSTAATINQKAQDAIDASGRAETSALNAADSERKALNYSQQAEQSAQEALESKNIAKQKAEIATGASAEALGYRDEAVNARDIAVQAKQNIVDYRDETKGYRDETLNLKNNVQTLKNQIDETAEEIEDISDSVKEDAQSASQSASSANQSSINASESASQAGQFADGAEQSANQAEQSMNMTEDYKNQSETYKNQSETFKNQAEQFKNQSETNVSHYPKIVNDYWYVWDATNGEYINTNVDANGIKGDTGRGVASVALNDDYTLTITFTDDTTYTTSSIRGQQGEKGDTGRTGESGVYIGTEEPENEDIKVWIDTDESADSGTVEDLIADITELKEGLNNVYEHSVTETLVTPVGDANGIAFVLFDIKAGHTYEIVADVLNKNASITISTRNTTSGDNVETIDTFSFSDPVRFVPQYDAKMFRVVTKTTGTITVTEKTSLEGLLDYVDANAEEINEINETILADDILNDNLSDGYIQTNGSVGSTVTLTKVPSGNIISAIIACNENDVFTVTGSGASNGRLWCFVDESYKIISHANVSVTETNKVLTAPDDGYLIINVNKGSTYSIRKKVLWIDAINNQYGTVKLYDNVTVENVQIKKSIATNAGIGQTISTSASDSSTFSSFTIAVAVNDEFYLYGFGGNTPRLWCLTDSNYVCQSVAGISVNALETPQHFKAPTNGYLIVNYDNTYGFTLLKRRDANSISTIEENYQNIAKVKETLPILEDSIANVSNIPLVHFNLNDYQLKDVSDYRNLVDYDSAGRDPMLEQFYDLFDSLVTNYSDYVSRVDAAELADLSYPSYANGVSDSSTYEDTPAYKTYMYKFIDTNLGAGNEAKNVKRKLLLICGTHGNEVMTPFNAFVFASELCKAIDSNYFKLRAAFDVYIIPCLNGYGMYHNQRPNADWIDINRNFPTSTWHVDGADTIGNKNTCVYTGTEAGSTFECQLIMALQDELSPEFVIDHHNYSGGDAQFYTNVDNTLYLRLVHQSLVDCSFAFVNGLPAYFGSDYKLIIPNRNVTFAPRQTEDNLNGKMVVWLTEHGTLFPCTIEIASDIRFLGGENTQSYNNWAGSDTFCVAEYTLRNQILTYGQYVLNRDALI